MTRGGRLFNKNVANCEGESLSTVSEFCLQAVRENRVQPEEAPLMGGGNYNPLKVTIVALKKSGRMLEHLEDLILPTDTFGNLSSKIA